MAPGFMHRRSSADAGRRPAQRYRKLSLALGSGNYRPYLPGKADTELDLDLIRPQRRPHLLDLARKPRRHGLNNPKRRVERLLRPRNKVTWPASPHIPCRFPPIIDLHKNRPATTKRELDQLPHVDPLDYVPGSVSDRPHRVQSQMRPPQRLAHPFRWARSMTAS
jgi:hypothetical protein